MPSIRELLNSEFVLRSNSIVQTLQITNVELSNTAVDQYIYRLPSWKASLAKFTRAS